MTTVNDQRLKADVAPLEAAAVEAILPVSGRDARMRLRRPASTLKETVCVVRYRLDSQLFDSVLVKVSACTPLVAYTPPQVCLPAMLRDAEADAVDSGKAVGMDAGIGAFYSNSCVKIQRCLFMCALLRRASMEAIDLQLSDILL